MNELFSYLIVGILLVVVVLLTWSLILIREDRKRKSSMRTRLAHLKKKVEDMPDSSPEEREKKDALQTELVLEYLENMLGEIEKLKAAISKKAAESKSGRKKGK